MATRSIGSSFEVVFSGNCRTFSIEPCDVPFTICIKSKHGFSAAKLSNSSNLSKGSRFNDDKASVVFKVAANDGSTTIFLIPTSLSQHFDVEIKAVRISKGEIVNARYEVYQ